MSKIVTLRPARFVSKFRARSDRKQLKTLEQIQWLAVKFPTQQNREFLQKNREFEQALVQSDFQMMFSEWTGPEQKITARSSGDDVNDSFS
jgi:hypothetical protein